MKKMLFAAILLAAVACSAPKHDGYTIKGTIAGITEGEAIIANSSDTEPITDTAVITEGKFEFIGKVTTPEFYVLTIGEKRMRLFLENSDIIITANIDSLNKAEITGAPINADIKVMQEKQEAVHKAFMEKYQLNELSQEVRDPATTPARKKEIEKIFEDLQPEINAMQEEIEGIQKAYMQEKPYSPYTAMLLYYEAGKHEISELTVLVDSMAVAPALTDNRYVKDLQEVIVKLKATEIGQQAPDFTQNNTEDKPVVFSDIYKANKLTMIDFWASWCGPCRAFNPTLVKLYNKYHKKGFEIIGVSFDKTKDAWLKGIQDDKLTWPQVSDLKYWSNAVGKQYYIRSIPQNVFVDATGKIIAKRVSEEEMDKFLADNLK